MTGASSGLGLHLTHVLARAGANVALAARRLDRLEATVSDIRQRGGRALAIRCDVTSESDIVDAVARAEAEFGSIDILVNNSGIPGGTSFMNTTGADWDGVLNTNLRGAFLMSRAFAARAIAAERRGRIINVGSILGLRTMRGLVPYSTSKAALGHMTAVLAMELGPKGITVNAIAPGYVETDINREFLRGPAGAAIAARIPLGRLGVPEDLDGAVLLLAFDAGRFITGVVLPIDGGHVVSAI